MSILQKQMVTHSAERSSSSQEITRLLAVIVIYKMRPLDSSTLQTLLASVENTTSENLYVKIIVWDNTPGGQDSGELPDGILYESAPHNPGLAQAYNQALELAEAEGYEWLLTLDQDSCLPTDFLEKISGFARELSQDKTVGAIVPGVIADGRIVSPFWFVFGVPRFGLGFGGTPKRAIYAVNSGSILRVSALREIGGYDPMFPLYVSDIHIFHRLFGSGKSVFIAGDVMVHHEVALMNKHTRMSIERYKDSLLDECAFWDLYMSPVARLERIVRFAVRAYRDRSIAKESRFWKTTLSELKRRLFTSRRKRIADWKKWATLRYSKSLQGSKIQPINLNQDRKHPVQW
jgi:GT2 family glycosyltransferase